MFYKIKHGPTGLFYKPGSGVPKTNLSKRGKVYQQRPTAVLTYILKCGYYHPKDSHEYNPKVTIPDSSEFEIIEFTGEPVSPGILEMFCEE